MKSFEEHVPVYLLTRGEDTVWSKCVLTVARDDIILSPQTVYIPSSPAAQINGEELASFDTLEALIGFMQIRLPRAIIRKQYLPDQLTYKVSIDADHDIVALVNPGNGMLLLPPTIIRY